MTALSFAVGGGAYAQEAEPIEASASSEEEPEPASAESTDSSPAPSPTDAPPSEPDDPPFDPSQAVDLDAPGGELAGEDATDGTLDKDKAASLDAPTKIRKQIDVSKVFSDDFEVRYWQMPDRLPGFEDRDVLDYVEAVNRFTANVRVNRWSFYGQLDMVALFANTYFLDDTLKFERELLQPGLWSPLIPGTFDPVTHGTEGWDAVSRSWYLNAEKIRVSYEAPGFSLQIGDTYAAFGRGVALNANRNVEIDIDTSIQGIKALWRPGAWDITAVFGQLNRQQVFQDNPNRGIFGDRRHTVGGLRVERFGLGPVNLGAHGVVYNFVGDEGWTAGFEELKEAPDMGVGGLTVEALGLGPTDWYLEADVFGFPTNDLFTYDDNALGYAVYLSTAVYAGPTTWLVEGKRYKNAERVNALLAPELYEIAIAPTLEYERAVTEDSSATLNSNDLWGGRVRMDWTAIPATLVPYWSLGVFRDEDDSPLHFNTVPETVYHPMVGVEYTQDAWTVLANVGFRYDDRDGDAFGADQQLHGDIIAKIPLAGGFSFDISVGAEWYQWGSNPIQQTDYAEMESSFALQYKGIFTFSWYTDYSTNPLIDSTGNLSQAVYGAGEVQIKPLPNLTLRAFYGAYKSGIRCSGGQCRVLPGFQGGRLSVTSTF